MKNGYATIIRSAKKNDADQANSIFAHPLYLVGSAECIMSCSNPIKPSLTTIDAIEPSMKQKRPDYAKRYDKVIFQYNNARSHVAKPIKETLEALNGMSYPPYSFQMLFPITIYFDEWLMRLSSAFIIMKILKNGLIREYSNVSFFRCGIHLLSER